MDALRKQEEFNRGISMDDPRMYHDDDPIRYISLMSSISHTYGNALAYMENYILSLFPENLFKTIHVNSRIAHRQIRSTGYEYTKKAKPMIIFRPRIADTGEDRFLKGTPLIERQGDLYSTWGATNLMDFMHDETRNINVKFQLNRSILYVDVLLIFSTLYQQMDFKHYIENAVRLEIPFSLNTIFESYLPEDMLNIISSITEIPLYDSHGSTREFLKYMESNSCFPITYKLQSSSGTREFYRCYPVNIDTLIGDLSSDEGEKVGHIMNQYQLSFTVKMEFFSTGFYYIFSDKLFTNQVKFPELYPEDSSIIPVFTDIVLKEDLNLKEGWKLYTSASCRPEKSRDSINFDELLNDSIRKVMEYHRDAGLPYFEFLDIKVRKQGKIVHEGPDYVIDYDRMMIHLNNKDTFHTYKILICINIEYINDLISQIFTLK